jgi:lipid-A-disaccharide synthase
LSGPLKIAIVAGEHSGDQLGFKLMRALKRETPVEFVGVGGEAMEAEGLESLFPMNDIAVMGILPVLARLPTLLARINETARRLVDARPDGLVIIDSPDFTHRVAKSFRAALPHLPVVDYVSPTVWAWRPGRARKMAAYVDCVLALLPFEPEAHRRLGGPACVYVGHPLIERLGELRGLEARVANRIVVLPGSRRSEIRRLSEDFGAALGLAAGSRGPLDVVLPTLPHVEALVREAVAGWPVQPHIVLGEAAKFEAFRTARAALAASGTVTLELGLAGTPLIGAYKVSKLEEQAKYIIKVPSILLPNLILERRAIPELVQHDCAPQKLADALKLLMDETPERTAQVEALAELDARMRLPGGMAPSEAAARAVLETLATAARRL